jgi:BirA family biotin operon repressor/biotin-[acetyl-CoA-carboxylase] ligase
MGLIDSTHLMARKLANSRVRVGTVIVAEAQSRGIGRYGKDWSSAPGGLYLTAILEYQSPPSILPLLVGVAVAETIREFENVRAELKWPNDVMVEGKKIAGVLVDTIWQEEYPELILVGIGVNINNRLPLSLGSATSVSTECGREIDIDSFLFNLLERLEYLLGLLKIDPENIVSRWRRLSETLGKDLIIRSDTGKIISGIAVDVDRDGALLVECKGFIRRVLSGTFLLR